MTDAEIFAAFRLYHFVGDKAGLKATLASALYALEEPRKQALLIRMSEEIEATRSVKELPFDEEPGRTADDRRSYFKPMGVRKLRAAYLVEQAFVGQSLGDGMQTRHVMSDGLHRILSMFREP